MKTHMRTIYLVNYEPYENISNRHWKLDVVFVEQVLARSRFLD